MSPRVFCRAIPRIVPSSVVVLVVTLAMSAASCDRILGIKDPTLGGASPDANTQGPADGPTFGITTTTIPARIAVSDTVSLTMVIAGPPNSSIGWSVDTGGGSFQPANGSVSTTSGGVGTITLQYTAPVTAGDLAHTLHLAFDSAVNAPFETKVRTLEGAGQLIPFSDNAGVSVPPNFLYGQQVFIPRRVVLMQLGFHSQLAGGTGRLALYTNVAGLPGTLVASSSLVATVVGPNDHRVPPTIVESGTYWILGNFSEATSVKRDAANSTNLAYQALVTSVGLPAQITGAMSTSNRVLNLYLRFAE